jgi:hypothetical protein
MVQQLAVIISGCSMCTAITSIDGIFLRKSAPMGFDERWLARRPTDIAGKS